MKPLFLLPELVDLFHKPGRYPLGLDPPARLKVALPPSRVTLLAGRIMLLPSRVTLLAGQVTLLPSRVVLAPDALDGLLKGFVLPLDPGELHGVSTGLLGGDPELILRLPSARLRLLLLGAQVSHRLTKGGGILVDYGELPGLLPFPSRLLAKAVTDPPLVPEKHRLPPAAVHEGLQDDPRLKCVWGKRNRKGKTITKKNITPYLTGRDNNVKQRHRRRGQGSMDIFEPALHLHPLLLLPDVVEDEEGPLRVLTGGQTDSWASPRVGVTSRPNNSAGGLPNQCQRPLDRRRWLSRGRHRRLCLHLWSGCRRHLHRRRLRLRTQRLKYGRLPPPSLPPSCPQ